MSTPTKMEYGKITKVKLAMCFYDPNQTQIFHSKRVLAIILAISAICSAILFIFFEADSATDYVTSAYLIAGSIGTFISFIDTSLKTTEIYSLLDLNERIFNQRSICSSLQPMYMGTGRVAGKFMKILDFTLDMGVAGLILPKAFYSFYLYLTTALGADAFELPLPQWLPFEWKNPIGYLVAILCQSACVLFEMRYLACFLILAVAAIFFSRVFSKDLVTELGLINENIQAKASETDILKRFIVFINLHGDIKELTNNFEEVYQTTLAILFSGCIVEICMTMLLFQMGMNMDGNSATALFEAVVLGFLSFIVLFCSSELGQRFSNTYEEIDDELNQMNWYLLPIKIQQRLPIIMMNTQPVMAIKCFGSHECNRETFRKAMYKGYSYFTVLREFI